MASQAVRSTCPVLFAASPCKATPAPTNVANVFPSTKVNRSPESDRSSARIRETPPLPWSSKE